MELASKVRRKRGISRKQQSVVLACVNASGVKQKALPHSMARPQLFKSGRGYIFKTVEWSARTRAYGDDALRR